jgi:hypothetical protein
MGGSLAQLAVLVRQGLPLPLARAVALRNYISLHNISSLIDTIVGGDDTRWIAAAGQVFEPSDGRAVATNELVRMMAHVMGRRAALIPVPIGLLRTLGEVAGRSELVSGAIDRVDTESVERLRSAFGWRPLESMPESLAFLS